MTTKEIRQINLMGVRSVTTKQGEKLSVGKNCLQIECLGNGDYAVSTKKEKLLIHGAIKAELK